jgi:hypothetical protein
MLVPRPVLWIMMAWAVAGSAAAQMPTMMQPMPNYQPEQNIFTDQPPDPGPRPCLDGKPKPGPAPKVVRVMPAPGSVVRPGPMVLSVTFDQPMACKANQATSPFPIPCPGDGKAVLISPDQRTLTTVCVVEAGSAYSMPLVDFVGGGGTRSERYDLAFTTAAGPPVKDARQALGLERVGSIGR